ncbi:MAG: DUF6379 domain-containing protein [Lachnospiraceae bacterium]|nr:DUF6379 domain-containing protein [Lachnospiraceae bacterium]
MMGFAMRMKLNDSIVKKETFRNTYIDGKRSGFEFKAQLAYYRGHFLSDIDSLEVYLDGEKMPDWAITFELNGKEMPLYKVYEAQTEFWSQVNQATIRVVKAGGVADGDHELDFRLMLRVPYMQIGPDHNFMPLDSGEKVTVHVEEVKEGKFDE